MKSPPITSDGTFSRHFFFRENLWASFAALTDLRPNTECTDSSSRNPSRGRASNSSLEMLSGYLMRPLSRLSSTLESQGRILMFIHSAGTRTFGHSAYRLGDASMQSMVRRLS